MDAFLLIALVIIIYLLFKIKSQQRISEAANNENFSSLRKELLALKEAAKTFPTTEKVADQPTRVDEPIVQWRPVHPSVVDIPPPILPAETANVISTLQDEPGLGYDEVKDEMATASAQEFIPGLPGLSPTTAVNESKWSTWVRNNPDLEKFIGENLVNKIGITVLVLGIAFFVKYAIDQNWIREAGRVAIGIGCGVLLTGLAHYLRNGYRSFSSVLAGGGLTVFYFTIAFGFHQYQLFSQTAAFVLMVLITTFAVLLSLLYNKLELAVIAAIGGFATPFLVSTGSGNYIILFSYLVILNAGMLTLAYFKKWPSITVIALFFTLLIYGGWLIQQTAFQMGNPPYVNGFVFATIFYVMFLGMTMIYNIRTRQPFAALDFSLLLLITFSYYAAGVTNLHFWNEGAYQGLFTTALGAINCSIAWYFFKVKQADKNLLYLLLGLTVTFISLAVPVQLKGHTITLFWSAEFVLLYWLHQRSGIILFKYASLVIGAGMVMSLLMDWDHANQPGGNHLPVLYLGIAGLCTNLVSVTAFGLYARLLRTQPFTTFFLPGITHRMAARIMLAMGMLVFYLTCIYGVNLYFYDHNSMVVPSQWHQLITYCMVSILLWLNQRYRPGLNIIYCLLLVAVCTGMFLLNAWNGVLLRRAVIDQQHATIHIIIHWLAFVVLLFLLKQTVELYRANRLVFKNWHRLFIWALSAVLVTVLSIELMNVYVFGTAGIQPESTAMSQYAKAGLTIVWAICSFIIMWLGMKNNYKPLRIISLVLFLMALVKLFLVDIRNISEGGKITAFILLGVLLLIISFMYQKLKKIIIHDASN